ncbi:MAG: TRAP transporter large permease subunit [Methylococcales bacterium]|jgi:tripartite ATP-independent transporter DctM subunit|nr:TRAP transporter large permease subunit [Methylococcales bacterium]MBT7409825.1 TRAP transporter large permease subunit [Methylococcales bacterium]
MIEFFQDTLPLFMFLSLIILLFSGFPIAFVLGGTGILFGFIGIQLDLFAFAEFNNLVLRIWGGIASNLLLVAVPMFIFMGLLLEKSKIAEDLLITLQYFLTNLRGGLAIAVLLMGTIFAATTGIIGASVVMLGVMSLPVLLKQNYKIEVAVGCICASGTLGILIPPSIMLVLMGEILSISVGELFVAAIIPGLLLASLYVIYLIILGHFKPQNIPKHADSIQQQSIPPLNTQQIIGSFLAPICLILLVLGVIFFGIATPTEASAIGAFGALTLALIKRNLPLKTLLLTCQQSANTTAMIFMIFIGATVFSYVFRSLGGDEIIEQFFEQLPFSSWGILLTVLGMVFLLGFFFDWIEITFIVLPLVAPVIEGLDFGEHVANTHMVLIWFALLVAINLQTSFLTPPFGFALFYLKGVAPPEVTIKHLYKGVMPFVLIQMFALGLILAFPALVTWLPGKM